MLRERQKMGQPLLKMTGINKHFPGVQALDNVSLEVEQGEIHGLLGENGAGKSTLLKILSGAYQPDSGMIELGGEVVTANNPHHAQELGIVTIYQEFNLVPSLSVAENIFIGREPGSAGVFVSWRQLREQARDLLVNRLGLDINPMRLVRDLSVAEQQMIEIARALSMKSRLIVMDEPTSALSENEVKQLFKIMRELKAAGLSVIFVTHRLEEVGEICDRITVLRDGRNAGEANIQDVDVNDIIKMMVGRAVGELFSRTVQGKHGAVALSVRGLSRHGTTQDPHATVLDNISFDVHKGEILGIAGLVGAGRTELARAIFGADPFSAGVIEVEGKVVKITSPRDAIRHGIGLVPEDRKQQALFLALAVRENTTIAMLSKLLRMNVFIDRAAEMSVMERYRKMLNIRMASSEQRVANLSGGNQQKVVIARWLALEPKVLIIDEPTRGIDVGAKAEVHMLLHEMAQNGIAIIMISSELPEIMAMSDRIITIREGRLTGEVSRMEATQEKLMQMMTLSSQQAASVA